jgi:hypothetical protein
VRAVTSSRAILGEIAQVIREHIVTNSAPLAPADDEDVAEDVVALV